MLYTDTYITKKNYSVNKYHSNQSILYFTSIRKILKYIIISFSIKNKYIPMYK